MVLLITNNSPCGENQADAAHPNGQQWWFNCGIDDNGWNPPHLTFDQIKYVDLSADGIYAPCAPYFDSFRAAAAKYNIPPVMVAAIAMQESTCQPGLTGGAGEAGMMREFELVKEVWQLLTHYRARWSQLRWRSQRRVST